MKRKYIKDQEGKFYPITSSDAVLCPSGNTLTEELDNVGDAKSVSSNDIRIILNTKAICEFVYQIGVYITLTDGVDNIDEYINNLNINDFFDKESIKALLNGICYFDYETLGVTKQQFKNFIENKGNVEIEYGLFNMIILQDSYFNIPTEENNQLIEQAVKQKFGIQSLTDPNYTQFQNTQISIYKHTMEILYKTVYDDDVKDCVQNTILVSNKYKNSNEGESIYWNVKKIKDMSDLNILDPLVFLSMEGISKTVSDVIYLYQDSQPDKDIAIFATEDKLYINFFELLGL